jgi:hypothetical protein
MTMRTACGETLNAVIDERGGIRSGQSADSKRGWANLLRMRQPFQAAWVATKSDLNISVISGS